MSKMLGPSGGKPFMMLYRSPEIVATQFIRKMSGGSQSVLVRGNDGNLYVVKMMGNPQGANVLANEMIGRILCEAIGFTVPQSCFVEMNKKFIDHTPELWFETRTGKVCPKAGMHHGICWLGDISGSRRALEYVTSRSQLKITNTAEFLGMYLFDIWANHHDRRQILYLNSSIARAMTAVFIDHGLLFGGGTWDFTNDTYQTRYRKQDTNLIVWNTEGVVRWIEIFKARIPSVLAYAVAVVPAEWHSGDIKELEDTLLERLYRVEKLAASCLT